MAVLQAYLADLLKELDEGEGFNVEDISELSFGLRARDGQILFVPSGRVRPQGPLGHTTACRNAGL